MPNLMLDKEISYMRKRLEKIYPNGVVIGLFKHDPNLYQYIKDYAYKNKSTVPRVLKSIGFKRGYAKNKSEMVISNRAGRQSQYTIEQAVQTLKELYPNGIITSLSGKNRSLYNYIFKCAHEKNMSIEKFLQLLGFQKQHAQSPTMPNDQIKQSLLQMYPNGEVISLHNRDSVLYYNVVKASKRQNKKIKEYLEYLGFKYARKVTGQKASSMAIR